MEPGRVWQGDSLRAAMHQGPQGGTVREVEVKYRVRDLTALLAALEMHGIELGEPFCQDDLAYAPDGWAYGDDRRGVPFARLRTVDDRHVFKGLQGRALYRVRPPKGEAAIWHSCLTY